MMRIFGMRGLERRDEAGALLARSAVEHWGLSELPALFRLVMGKPVFPDSPQLQFNLSHSGPLALCALSDRPVGVDIEFLRPRRAGLAERILSPAELAWYREHGEGTESLLTLWTRKEALCKYRGTGLTFPVRDIAPPLPGQVTGLPLVHSYRGEDWVAAVCGEELFPIEITWLEPEEQKGGSHHENPAD